MSFLFDVLFAFLGLMLGGIAIVPTAFLITSGMKLVEGLGRRQGIPAKRRITIATTVISVLLAVYVVGTWFAAGGICGWLGLVHTRAIQVGATIGALGMGGMAWVFVCCALDQLIKNPELPSDPA